ncbi:polyhydroxyalkanoate depolymerase [Piscinibacter sakaiensis]|uniref:polyhydroxyalkanoate depolymerase n=1 Tax=Piscinibacter sakaiensis TaxID=1547922 RepID=UPI003AB0FE49
MMYDAYQAHAEWMTPIRHLVHEAVPLLDRLPATPVCHGFAAARPQRRILAACKTFALAEVTHHRPPFAIDSVTIGTEDVAVSEEAMLSTPFATLLHFRKQTAPDPPQAKVLIAAPMSGHFATLLRDTVRTMLPDHDVYITDWHNARNVPLSAGRFGLDEYIDHLMDFVAALGPDAHLVAICQPCVAALAAVALMSEQRHPATPASLTLMAGPIDCRISPTAVNALANSKPIGWFEQHLISGVPWRHAGAGRRVYPGFVQLGAFISMNRSRHLQAFREYYELLCEPDPDPQQQRRLEATRAFYEEYLAVADLPAEFYLETVAKVFQHCDLATGRLRHRDRAVDPASIRRTALLTIEGERDDICSAGQTLAAQDLCSGLRPWLRTHYVQAGVGHYGVFSGRKWQNQIYPLLREVIRLSQ